MKTETLTIRRRQRGATLVVALVMLILMTMLAISAINLSTGNLKVVGNVQLQKEASDAAQGAIAQMLSRAVYLIEPTTAPEEIVVNINGRDQTVAMKRPCLKQASFISIRELNQLPPQEALKCRSTSAISNSGIMGQSTGGEPSDCSRVTWELQANVDDTVTNTRYELTEGATIKMDRVLADAYKSNPAMRCS